MYGAILGDIVGSPYEFDCNNYKGKDFPLFSQRSEFTDDTVMTLAVARALLDTRGQDDITIKAALVREMQRLGRAYPDKGYGARFNQWLYEDDPDRHAAPRTQYEQINDHADSCPANGKKRISRLPALGIKQAHKPLRSVRPFHLSNLKFSYFPISKDDVHYHHRRLRKCQPPL